MSDYFPRIAFRQIPPKWRPLAVGAVGLLLLGTVGITFGSELFKFVGLVRSSAHAESIVPGPAVSGGSLGGVPLAKIEPRNVVAGPSLASDTVPLIDNWFVSPPQISVRGESLTKRPGDSFFVALFRRHENGQLINQEYPGTLFFRGKSTESDLSGTVDTRAIIDAAYPEAPHGWYGFQYRLGDVLSARYDFNYAFSTRFVGQSIENKAAAFIRPIDDGNGLRMSQPKQREENYSSLVVKQPFRFPGGIVVRGRCRFQVLDKDRALGLELAIWNSRTGNVATTEIEAGSKSVVRMKTAFDGVPGPDADMPYPLPQFPIDGKRDIHFLIQFKKDREEIVGRVWVGYQTPRESDSHPSCSIIFPHEIVGPRPDRLTLRIRGAGTIEVRDLLIAEAVVGQGPW